MAAKSQIWGCCLAFVLAMTLACRARAQVAPATSFSGDLTKMSLEDLMNVEVTTVSRQKQALSDTPAAVYVITQEDIQRTGLNTIPELIRLAPGMDVARFNSNTWAISSRGFNDVFSNKLLVLVDGRSVYSPAFGGVFWDQIDYVLPDLDRIEVVRGPGATLWGSNAVNGVINVVSKSAQDTQGLLVNARAGNDAQIGAIRLGGQIDDQTYFRVYTKYRNFDDFLTASGQGANDQWQSIQGGFRIDRYSGSGDTLTFQGDIYGEELSMIQKQPVLAAPYLLTRHNAYNDDTGDVLARWTHTGPNGSEFTLQTYYQRLDWYNLFSPYKEDTFDIDFQHRFPIASRQRLIWGVGYRMVLNRDYPQIDYTFDPRSRAMQVASGFVQDDITVVPERVHVIVGTKLEYDTYVDFQVQPSGKVLWTPNQKNTVWGSISRAVATPTRYEEDSTTLFAAFPTPFGPAGSGSVPNRHLNPEDMVAYEIGYRFRPNPALSFDLATFYDNYNNLIGTEQLPPVFSDSPPPLHPFVGMQWQNNMAGQAYGAELAVGWKVFDNWRLSGSYSFLELQIQTASVSSLSRQSYFEGSSPQHQFQLRSYYNLTRNVQLNAMGWYVSELSAGHIPGYFRVDANVAWQVNDHLQLMAGVQNIFDNRHPEFSDVQSFTVASQTPRTFFAQLNFSY
ncbi:MAG TPA: TonB-dependent receptor [Tepidisphaeraceae bacterium]|nr:TonB-dependent receptor [Tepidisphaeraceae bacterium]